LAEELKTLIPAFLTKYLGASESQQKQLAGVKAKSEKIISLLKNSIMKIYSHPSYQELNLRFAESFKEVQVYLANFIATLQFSEPHLPLIRKRIHEHIGSFPFHTLKDSEGSLRVLLSLAVVTIVVTTSDTKYYVEESDSSDNAYIPSPKAFGSDGMTCNPGITADGGVMVFSIKGENTSFEVWISIWVEVEEFG
jgi:hypothetical protein